MGPLMIRALKRLRASGFIVCALTNNFDTEPLPDKEEQTKLDEAHQKFVALFDHFIESRVVGLSKPDPQFYMHALKAIGCAAEEAIFLDDIGVNVKAARKLGIDTILVKNTSETSFHDALRELERRTGVALLDNAKL